MDFLLDIAFDAAKDTLALVPFLVITYLAVGALELLAGERVNSLVQRAGAAGPVIGAFAGIFPQCGFSAMGSALYAERVISLGTLVAVFLSTSDEMLPLLIAEQAPALSLVSILVSKALIAAMAGFGVDTLLRARHARLLRNHECPPAAQANAGMPQDAELAVADNAGELDPSAYACDCGCGCGCEDGVPLTKREVMGYLLRYALYHTVEVSLFIFAVSLVLGGILEGVGEEALAGFLSSNAVLATFASGLVGLIPNCAASVVITQLYLDGALALGPMMAGSLAAAGAGYLVLFRVNESPRENAAIVTALYAISVLAGLFIMAVGL